MHEEITDEQLQAQLQALRVREPQKKCPGGRPVTRICTNPKCQQALLCAEAACKECFKPHIACPTVNLTGITHLLNERIAEFQEFAEQTMYIESVFVSELRQSRSRLIKSFELRNLEKEQLAVFRAVYEGGEEKGCSGKEARGFVEALQKEREETAEKAAGLLQGYK
jgi:hypothetical protein